jgi:hypothetical protein
MNLKDTSKSFKLLTIGFESSTMALINLTTFGVAVGATVLEVKVARPIIITQIFTLNCSTRSWLSDPYKMSS